MPANATANAPLGTAAGRALGTTREALPGAWLLRRLVGSDQAPERVQAVLGLVVLAAGVSTMVSATLGATSLFRRAEALDGVPRALGRVVAGGLRGRPGGRPPAAHPGRLAPQTVAAAALPLGLGAVSLLGFAGPIAPLSFHPLAYAVFPFGIWAALRFGQPAAALMTFVASSTALGGTRPEGGFGLAAAPGAWSAAERKPRQEVAPLQARSS
jgi:hypothetical protein